MADVDDEDEEAERKKILKDVDDDTDREEEEDVDEGEEEEEEKDEEDETTNAAVDEDDEAAYLGFLEKTREETIGEPDEDTASATSGEESAAEEESEVVGTVGTYTDRIKAAKNRMKKGEMEGLHAESQRLLRESTGAAFSTVPPVPKPISSVLEKIRARKRQLTLSAAADSFCSWSTRVSSQQEAKYEMPAPSDTDDCGEHSHDVVRGVVDGAGAGPELVTRSIEESLDRVEEANNTEGLEPGNAVAGQAVLASTSCSNQQEGSQCDGLVPSSAAQLEPNSQALPLDSQLSREFNRQGSPVDEERDDPRGRSSKEVPEVDTDEEEEEGGEEKHNAADGPYKTRGKVPEEKCPLEYITARAMIDDEAEDEDDDGKGDSDEELDEHEGDLQDLVAQTAPEEKPSDKRKRDKLHQEWLAERDQAATADILDRLNNGWRRNEARQRAAGFLDEDFSEQDSIGVAKRMRASRSRDNNVSDSVAETPWVTMDKEKASIVEEEDEDESAEQILHNRCLADWHSEGDLLTGDNEVSREVLGLINRANMHQQKAMSISGSCKEIKKPSPEKPSFLNKATSTDGKRGKKLRLRDVPSFIFGPSKGNGRSSVDIVEDDDVQDKENNIQVAQRTPAPVARPRAFANLGPSIDVWSTPSKPAEGPQLHDLLKLQAASLDRSLRGNDIHKNHSRQGMMGGELFGRVKSFKSGSGFTRI